MAACHEVLPFGLFPSLRLLPLLVVDDLALDPGFLFLLGVFGPQDDLVLARLAAADVRGRGRAGRSRPARVRGDAGAPGRGIRRPGGAARAGRTPASRPPAL